jgi:penicillin-binding protein 1A
MKADTAHLVDFVLQQVIARGTGTAAKLDRPVAGKTGTTENSGDAWFAGYTPNYAAVVWMGYPEGNSKPMDSVHGITVTGGTFPAQIWKKFMSVALTDVPKDDFPAPPDKLLAAPTADSAASASSDGSEGSAPPPDDSTTSTSNTTTPSTTSTTSTSTTSTTATSTTTTTTQPKGKSP